MRAHARDRDVFAGLIFVDDEGGNAGKHLRKVFLHLGGHLAAPDELKQVFISNEIEPRKLLTLLLKVVSKRLLDTF